MTDKTIQSTSRRGQVQRPFDDKRKEAYLEALREAHGVQAVAIRAVSGHSTRVNKNGTAACWTSLKQAQQRDPEFNAECQVVAAECVEVLEHELIRRAMGTDEPLYQAGRRVLDTDSEGRPIKATVKRYSDGLLLKRLAAMKPELYADKKNVHVTVGAQRYLMIGREDLACLDHQRRGQLGVILQIMADARSGEAKQITAEDADYAEVSE